MKDFEIKQIVALVFIKAVKEYPEASSKSQLAEKLTQSNPHFRNKVGAKSLVNYFNYFLDNGSLVVNPSQDSIEAMLQYVGYQSVRQFKENPPSASQIREVPFLSKEEHTTYEKNQERYENSQKQENISNATINENSHNHVEIGKVDNSINKSAVVIIAILTVLAIVVGVFIYFSQDKLITVQTNPIIPNKTVEKNCAYWNGQRYIKEYCNERNNLIPIADLPTNWENFNRVYPSTYNEFIEADGNTKLWYYKYYNQWEFYNSDGNHPHTYEALSIVTPEIAKEYLNIPNKPSDLTPVSKIMEDESTQNSPSEKEIYRPNQHLNSSNRPNNKNSKSLDNNNETLSKCEKENTGSICFQNETEQPLQIQLIRYGRTNPLVTFIKTMNLNAKNEGCFYDIPVATYSYILTKNHKSLNQTHAETNISICQKSIKVIK